MIASQIIRVYVYNIFVYMYIYIYSRVSFYPLFTPNIQGQLLTKLN